MAYNPPNPIQLRKPSYVADADWPLSATRAAAEVEGEFETHQAFCNCGDVGHALACCAGELNRIEHNGDFDLANKVWNAKSADKRAYVLGVFWRVTYFLIEEGKIGERTIRHCTNLQLGGCACGRMKI